MTMTHVSRPSRREGFPTVQASRELTPEAACHILAFPLGHWPAAPPRPWRLIILKQCPVTKEVMRLSPGGGLERWLFTFQSHEACDALGTPQRRGQKGVDFYLKDKTYSSWVGAGRRRRGREGRRGGGEAGRGGHVSQRSSSQFTYFKPKTSPLLGQFNFLGISFPFSLRWGWVTSWLKRSFPLNCRNVPGRERTPCPDPSPGCANYTRSSSSHWFVSKIDEMVFSHAFLLKVALFIVNHPIPIPFPQAEKSTGQNGGGGVGGRHVILNFHPAPSLSAATGPNTVCLPHPT